MNKVHSIIFGTMVLFGGIGATSYMTKPINSVNSEMTTSTEKSTNRKNTALLQKAWDYMGNYPKDSAVLISAGLFGLGICKFRDYKNQQTYNQLKAKIVNNENNCKSEDGTIDINENNTLVYRLFPDGKIHEYKQPERVIGAFGGYYNQKDTIERLPNGEINTITEETTEYGTRRIIKNGKLIEATYPESDFIIKHRENTSDISHAPFEDRDKETINKHIEEFNKLARMYYGETGNTLELHILTDGISIGANSNIDINLEQNLSNMNAEEVMADLRYDNELKEYERMQKEQSTKRPSQNFNEIRKSL